METLSATIERVAVDYYKATGKCRNLTYYIPYSEFVAALAGYKMDGTSDYFTFYSSVGNITVRPHDVHYGLAATPEQTVFRVRYDKPRCVCNIRTLMSTGHESGCLR